MRNVYSTLSMVMTATSVILSTSCREETRVEGTNINKGFEHWFPLHLDKTKFMVQVAVTKEEKAKGLMHRDRLGNDHGMLFVFRKPSKQSFWMRNTRIPLDLGYFSQGGILREIHAAQPFDEGSYPSRNENIQFVLELNQGAYRSAGLGPGTKLNFAEMATALMARGYSASEFGLAQVQSGSASPR